MREYLSPGVYTQEYDRSFLQTAQSMGSAAVFIGGFTKGQALVPMRIKDTNDLIKKTGQPNGRLYSQYAAFEYSKHKGNFFVQRLLWQDEWKADGYALVMTTGSDTEGKVLATLASPYTGTGSVTFSADSYIGGTGSSTGSAPNDKLKFTTTVDGVQFVRQLKLEDIDSIQNIFGTDPYQPSQKDMYCFSKYIDGSIEDMLPATGTWKIQIHQIEDLYDFGKYSGAMTPWIKDSVTEGNLFKFHTIGDGTYANRQVKIAIENINTRNKTTFDVIIRAYDDTDKRPQVLEAYYDLNLDPMSDNFIGRRIGEMYQKWDDTAKKMISYGDYHNVSSYVRVQLSDDVKFGSVNPNANPAMVDYIPAWYATDDAIEQITAENYAKVLTQQDNLSELKPYTSHQGYQTRYDSVRALSNPVPVDATIPKFTHEFTQNYILVMYGGFDGRNPSEGYINNATTIGGQDVSEPTSSGSQMFKRAFGMLRNVQEYDINIVSVPGLNLKQQGKAHLTQYLLQNLCQYRGDCIFVGDVAEPEANMVAPLLTVTQAFDTSFGAVYFPSYKVRCPYTKTFPVVPAATYIPSVIAYTQQVSLPHYAPAGINRGTLDVLQATTKLNKQQRDLLYKNKINPIASFAADGTVVWGQKTLQTAASALDRVNARLLSNNIVKWITAYGRTVLFDNNSTNLRAVFTLGAQRYLDDLVMSNGLYAYKFVMDESNNTPQVIDRNQLVGQLWVKMSKTTEFIIIPINVMRSDAQL